jgi:hypothetical protein
MLGDDWGIQDEAAAPYHDRCDNDTANWQDRETGTMDTVINASDYAHRSGVSVAIPAPTEDHLAFFQALWFWIPAGLGLWSALIWALLHLI